MSCLALQIYTALVSVFFAWLFFRPRRSDTVKTRPKRHKRDKSSQRAQGHALRDIAGTGAADAPLADADDGEPFLDPETIAAWNSTLLDSEPLTPARPARRRRPAKIRSASASVPRSRRRRSSPPTQALSSR